MVLVKQVPDTWSKRKLTDDKFILDRELADAVLDETNENVVEAALQLREEHGGNVTVATAGPDRAIRTLRKALSMGADDAVILSDDALRGSDAAQTAWALSNVISIFEDIDLIVTGNTFTDGGTDSVPVIFGVYHDLPVPIHLRPVAIDSNSITGECEVEDDIYQFKASLSAVVSVTERANSPRFASFKDIIAAKRKPVTELTLDDVVTEIEQVGPGSATTDVTDSTPKPVKTADERINSEGDGSVKLAECLKAQKFIQGAQRG